MDVYGNPATVVLDTYDVVLFEYHDDVGAIAGKGLVHCVVHHLVHQVMKTIQPGGADIHSGTFPDRFESLEHLYAVR